MVAAAWRCRSPAADATAAVVMVVAAVETLTPPSSVSMMDNIMHQLMERKG